MCSSEGTAQAELQLLREIQDTLKESAVPHVMVYATQPFTAQSAATRRSLLQAAKQKQPQFVCDATCQTQVTSVAPALDDGLAGRQGIMPLQRCSVLQSHAWICGKAAFSRY